MFKQEVGFGMVVEIRDNIVVVLDGEKVVEEIFCKTNSRAKKLAERMENRLMHIALAMC